MFKTFLLWYPTAFVKIYLHKIITTKLQTLFHNFYSLCIGGGWNFTNMFNCFCCYVIKSAGEITKKVLLPVIWNLMLIEIHLSQIRISGSKREKVLYVRYARTFYSKAVGYQRRNVLNMFSNTMIIIYKECDNLCVFSNDTMYFFFIFYSWSLKKYNKKNFS